MKVIIFVVLAVTVLQSGTSLPDEDHWTEQSHDDLMQVASPTDSHGDTSGSSVMEFDDSAETRDHVHHIMAEIRETATKIPMLNLGEVLAGISEQAEVDLKELKAKAPAMKAKKKAARSDFRAKRRSLRKDYRACKQSITKSNINLNAAVCKAFKAGQTVTLTEVDSWEMKKNRRRAHSCG